MASILLAGCSVSVSGFRSFGKAPVLLPDGLDGPPYAPVICDVRHPDHVAVADPEKYTRGLWQAVLGGELPAGVAGECVERLELAATLRSQWYGRAVDHVLRKSTRRKPAEPGASGQLQAIVNAMAKVPLSEAVSPGARERWRTKLERKSKTHGRPAVAALVDLLELNDGKLAGKPVTGARIDAAADDELLERMARVLPDDKLRRRALTRWVRRRAEVAFGPGAEADDAVRRVVDTGRNDVTQGDVEIESVRLDPDRIQRLRMVVDQDTHHLEVHLRIGARGSVQEVWEAGSMRRTLWADVQGREDPITVCAPPEDFSVEPCLHPAAVDLGNDLIGMAKDGRLATPGTLKMAKFSELVADGWSVTLTASVDNEQSEPTRVPMDVRPLPPLLFHGATAGADGQKLSIVLRDIGGHVLFRLAADQSGERSGFVAYDGHGFMLVSQGAQGQTGAMGKPGAAGNKGSDGSNASCPSSSGTSGGPGGNGQPGGQGGPGGPGGNGGNVIVELRCDEATCAKLDAFARGRAFSRGGTGGRGGPGGPGGRGGDGGKGGSGATCTEGDQTKSLGGGSSGSRGSDGAKGPDGSPGRRGRDRGVEVRHSAK